MPNSCIHYWKVTTRSIGGFYLGVCCKCFAIQRYPVDPISENSAYRGRLSQDVQEAKAAYLREEYLALKDGSSLEA